MHRTRPPLRITLPLLLMSLGLAASLSRVLAGPIPSGGALVCSAANDQNAPAIASDGVGGAFIAWSDTRSGTADIYVQRVDSTGAPLWAANGVPVCTAPGAQTSVAIVGTSFGVFVAWTDNRNNGPNGSDVYVRLVTSSGTPSWTANGNGIGTALNNQSAPTLISDGSTGVIVAWQDARNSFLPNIYVQHLNISGLGTWTLGGVQVANGTTSGLRMVTDGSAGAILTWADSRGGAGADDIYAQRVTSSGTPAWTANGVPISQASGPQSAPQLASDGSGGAVIAWQNGNLNTATAFAQRVNSAGVAQWTAGGISLSAGSGNNSPQVVSTSDHGAIIAWSDQSSATLTKLYAQRLGPTGAAQWFPNGQIFTLLDAIVSTGAPVAASDGVDGMIGGWLDSRLGTTNAFVEGIDSGGGQSWNVSSGTALSSAPGGNSGLVAAPSSDNSVLFAWADHRFASNDIYFQRVNRTGSTRCADRDAPALNPVRDVAHDQGGAVALTWRASGFDAPGAEAITSYRVWRRLPASSPASASHLEDAARHTPDRVHVRRDVQPDGALAITYWEALATVPAGTQPGYGFVAATTSDSSGSGNPFTAFYVSALTDSPFVFFESSVDSGYSVDNIAPAAPAPFTGTYGATNALHWGVSGEADLLEYRLHRGASPGFVPGPGNLVLATSDTGAVDAAGGAVWYKLAAVDVHGNVSPYALVSPGGAVDVPREGSESGLWLGRAMPNPAREDCLIHFGLAVGGRARLTLFDTNGRSTRTLLNGVLPAGPAAVRWDGRLESGDDAPGGVYFYRLETGGRTLEGRLVRIR